MGRVRIVFGDPGLKSDPFGIVGIDLNMLSGVSRISLARQFVRPRLSVVADYLLNIKKVIKPHIMALESNNQGGKIIQLFHQKYNLNVMSVATTSTLNAKSRERYNSMDKKFTIDWMVENNTLFEYPPNPSGDMLELIRQRKEMVGIRTANGTMSIKRQRGRHDDLFMSLVGCAHFARLFMMRTELAA